MPNPAGDQYFSSVKLLLHGDGSNGSTSLTDSSASAHGFTAVGNAQLKTARPKFGTAAMEFDGSGDWFQAANSSDFSFGSGDFTIEGWFQTDSVTGLHALLGYANGNSANSNYELQFLINGTTFSPSLFSGTTQYNPSKTGVVISTTHSWCVERYGNSLFCYLDGVVSSGVSVTGVTFNNPAASILQIGEVQGSFAWSGMIDELRITKGVARYKGTTYTPATAAFPNVGLVATGFLATNFGAPTVKRVQPVTGFMPTRFGTPVAVYDRFEDVTGWSAINFGTPRVLTLKGQASGFFATNFGTPKIIPQAVGWFATHFGTPRVVVYAHATGFMPTHFGTPTLSMKRQVESLGMVTHFGTPTTPTYRECRASGFFPTKFGDAVSLQYTPLNLDRALPVSGWKAIHFGKPAAAATVTGVASGFYSTNFGTPAATQSTICQATGIAPAGGFGTPTVRMVQRATGFKTTHFGAAKAKQVCFATSIAPHTRFGTPTYTRSGGHHVYGWFAARFGRPRAFICHAYQASGFMPTRFGTPSAHYTCRASSIAPKTHFGVPQAVRNPRC